MCCMYISFLEISIFIFKDQNNKYVRLYTERTNVYKIKKYLFYMGVIIIYLLVLSFSQSFPLSSRLSECIRENNKIREDDGNHLLKVETRWEK